MSVEVHWHAVPIPRVYAVVLPGGGDLATRLAVGFELGNRYGDPMLRVERSWEWRRPRPWELDVDAPRRGPRRFQWRRRDG